jgi:hypothetical protein
MKGPRALAEAACWFARIRGQQSPVETPTGVRRSLQQGLCAPRERSAPKDAPRRRPITTTFFEMP